MSQPTQAPPLLGITAVVPMASPSASWQTSRLNWLSLSRRRAPLPTDQRLPGRFAHRVMSESQSNLSTARERGPLEHLRVPSALRGERLRCAGRVSRQKSPLRAAPHRAARRKSRAAGGESFGERRLIAQSSKRAPAQKVFNSGWGITGAPAPECSPGRFRG